jgi:hypothetical protein
MQLPQMHAQQMKVYIAETHTIHMFINKKANIDQIVHTTTIHHTKHSKPNTEYN